MKGGGVGSGVCVTGQSGFLKNVSLYKFRKNRQYRVVFSTFFVILWIIMQKPFNFQEIGRFFTKITKNLRSVDHRLGVPPPRFMVSYICHGNMVMVMVTEEQNHEYLKNAKRYQKISENRPPKTCPFYVYI